MTRPPRSMPTCAAVHRYWHDERPADWEWLFKQHDCTVASCYVCGDVADLERAHIVDRTLDGLDGPQNLALLCRRCHLLMPSIGPHDEQWRTFVEWTHAARAYTRSVRGLVVRHESLSERTKAGMAAKKRQGVRMGRPVTLSPAVRDRVAELHASGLSLRAIAAQLTDEGAPTATGGRWHASTVRQVLGTIALHAEATAA